ncbi:putative transcription factor bHLH family [Helianthus debilis subsp. tardiflorus]
MTDVNLNKVVQVFPAILWPVKRNLVAVVMNTFMFGRKEVKLPTVSLAERVRREKISERMKFLQDLVPGCSKVIRKAVMLDEIINYVQSPQRQFLSMKLATINPQMDFNLEGLLAKDAMELRLGPSGSLGTDMAMPYALNQSQMEIMQGGISGVGRSSDAGRRRVNSHLMSISGGFKDPISQL